MTIAPPRVEQHLLWNDAHDRVMTSTAQGRAFSGMFFEECTATLTGARRLQTRNGCVCPDLKYFDDDFFEVKGCGRSGRAIVFKHRLLKDEEVSRNFGDYHYWFWAHTCNVNAFVGRRRSELCAELLRCTHAVYVVSLPRVLQIRETKPRKYNYTNQNHGALPEEKVDGWEVPLSLIELWCSYTLTVPAQRASRNHMTLSLLPVHFSDPHQTDFIKTGYDGR